MFTENSLDLMYSESFCSQTIPEHETQVFVE